MQRDRIANGGGKKGFDVVIQKYLAGEYDKDWRGLSEKEQTRKKEIEAVGVKTDEKPFGSWQPFDDGDNAGQRPLYAALGTGRLNDPKDVGPVDGYTYEPSTSSSSTATVAPPKPAPTMTSTSSDTTSNSEDFIKNAWQSQLGSSQVSSQKGDSRSPLGSSVTEPSVSEDVSSAWKKQGFDCTKIDRV